MIRAAASCFAVFAHAEFRYRAGLLHSEDDKPSATIKPSHKVTKIAPYSHMHLQAVRASWMACINLAVYEFIGSQHLRTCWYADGDLHRDYGPALTAKYHVYPLSWYKYCRGKMMALDTNTFTDDPQPPNYQLLAYCVCGGNCVRLVAREQVDHLPFSGKTTDHRDARVYHTCTGTKIECSRAGDDTANCYYRLGERVKKHARDTIRTPVFFVDTLN